MAKVTLGERARYFHGAASRYVRSLIRDPLGMLRATRLAWGAGEGRTATRFLGDAGYLARALSSEGQREAALAAARLGISPGTVAFLAMDVNGQKVFSGSLSSVPERNSETGTAKRLVRIDPVSRIVLAPRTDLGSSLNLKLISASTDQETYWPNEAVNLAILLPGRSNAEVDVTLTKKGGVPQSLGRHKVDGNGVLSLRAMDGSIAPLVSGEYTLQVSTADKALQATANFSVLEGSLGALSFAHPWVQVSGAQLKDGPSKLPPGYWHMAERGGQAGDRWGHGLPVRNIIFEDGQPYNGKATINTRCYLPGCNGKLASLPVEVEIKDGILEAALDTGGHSGPLEIEVVMRGGSLRHLFSASGHVERRLATLSQGLGNTFKAGLAPYEGTQAVPGRQIFWQQEGETKNDPLVLQSPVSSADGKVVLRAAQGVSNPKVYVFVPNEKGEFTAQELAGLPSYIGAGDAISVPVTGPYSLVVVAGSRESKFFEGHGIVFTPGKLEVKVTLPKEAAPLAEVPIEVVTSANGARVQTSGILTVYDTRVDHHDPSRPLTSELGRSLRNGADQLSGMEDTTGLQFMGPTLGVKGLTGGTSAFRGAGSPIRRLSAGSRGGTTAELEAPSEAAEEGQLREGAKKVVFSGRIETGPEGFITVPVQLGPQMGRYRAEFTAVHGTGFTSGNAQVDATKPAAVESNLPAVLVPGAEITATAIVRNFTGGKVTLRISGAGLKVPVEKEIENQQETVPFNLTGGTEGNLLLEVRAADGKVVDRRQLSVRNGTVQPATVSKLTISDGKTPVSVAAGERAAVYRSAGHMLQGVLTNMETTLLSWFPHAEANSAAIATKALTLKAIEAGVIDAEGKTAQIVSDIIVGVRDLRARFFNEAEGLFVPYPGMKESNTLWSAWVARNLQSAVSALEQTAIGQGELREALDVARDLIQRVNRTLTARGESIPELAGYDPSKGNREVVMIKTPEGESYQVLTDTAVISWVTTEFYPDLKAQDRDLLTALYKLSGIGRLLGAYERVGRLPYLVQLAKAAWSAGEGEREKFYALFSAIARGAIRTQEPGVIQGPALLGGIYGSPQALVRFLELLVMMAESERKGEYQRPVQIVKVSGEKGLIEERVPQSGTAPLVIEGREDARSLHAPEFAAVAVEGKTTLNLKAYLGKPAFFKVEADHTTLKVGQPTRMQITLDEGKDPLEYQVLVIAPSTVSIQQTGDILLDYRGRPLYGQRATGGERVQMMAIPFRGSRRMILNLEGVQPGTSPGIVLVRHMNNPDDVSAVEIDKIQVE